MENSGQEKAACRLLKDERVDHALPCQSSPWRTRKHDRVRDSLARQMRKVGATADLERATPQWSRRYMDELGADKIRVARIDVVATVQGRDELQMAGRSITVRPRTHSDLIPWAQKIEFESCK